MTENALHSCHKNQEVNARSKISSSHDVSRYQYNSQWMAHWKEEEFSNNERRPEALSHMQNIRCRKLEMLNPDLSREYKNSSRSDSQKLVLALDSHSSAEPSVSENGRIKLNNCALQKGFKSNGMNILLSDSAFQHKLPDSSSHWRNKEKRQLSDIGDVSPEENLFPMYDINRKIESFLNRQKRFGCVNKTFMFSETQVASEKLKPGTEYSGTAEDHLLTLQKTSTFEEIELLESAKDSYCHENYVGGIFNPQIANPNIFKYPQEKGGSLSTNSMLHKHSTKGLSSPLGSLVEKKRGGKLIANGAETSRQLEINGSMRVIPRSTRSVTEIPYCCTRDAETLRIHTSSRSMINQNGKTENVSNSFHYRLITKKMESKLSHHEQVNEILTCSLKGKRKALYEMLAVPTTSESLSTKQEFSQVIMSSSNIGDGDNSDRSDAHVSKTKSRTSAKHATIPSGAYEKPSSAKVPVSEKLHKDLQQQRLMKSHHASKSLAKQGLSDDAETDILDTNALSLASSDRSGSIYQREQATSRTESMNVGQALSEVWKPNASTSVGIKESSSQLDPCRGWLKRLQYNSLDSLQIDSKSKRPRVGDGSSTGKICSLLGKASGYNASQSDMMKTKHLMEKRICDETNHFASKTKSPTEVTLKEVQCWVGRWCHKDTKVTSSQAKQVAGETLSKPEAFKLIPEGSEGKQFPSIGAMALMGKVMSNLHTCEFQRRGSSIVWKTKSLEN